MKGTYPGHEAVGGLVVRILIRDSEGRVLLHQRASKTGYGLWTFPGGKPDPGEEEKTAAIREAREETGLVVENLCYLDEFTFDDLTGRLYEALAYYGDLQIDGIETKGLGWFSPQNIDPATLAFAHDRYFLERLATYDR